MIHIPTAADNELKRKVAESLALDRQRLLVRMPFLGSILMRLELIPVRDDRLITAATDGDRIFVDSEFYSKLDDAERQFVVAHEAWHCALIHFMRRQNREHDLFNQAADLEIHFLLSAEGFRAPFVLPHDYSWNGKSAEEIYELLLKQKDIRDNARECDHIKHQDFRGGRGFDRHLERGQEQAETDTLNEITLDPEYVPHLSEGAEERNRERLASAAIACERTRGSVPADIAGIVGKILKPELNWREMLAQFVTSCYGGSRRWLPPARRHVWKGLYLQSQRTERLRAVVAIDTSGSTCQDLPRFFGELTGLLNAFGHYDLTIIYCDAAVAKVEQFDDANPVDANRKWQAHGGGGTDFSPPFEYVARHAELDPSLFIYFTDGWGPAPKKAPPYPVMWLLTSGSQIPAQWGTSVHFKNDIVKYDGIIGNTLITQSGEKSAALPAKNRGPSCREDCGEMEE